MTTTANAPPSSPREPWGLPARFILVTGVLALVFLFSLVALHSVHNGAYLGRRISKWASSNLRGRILVGSVRWPLNAPLDFILGRAVRVSLADVEIFDPRGAEVIRAQTASARIDGWSLLRAGRLVLSEIRVNNGYCAIEEMEYSVDDQSLGIAAAFFPARRSGSAADSDNAGPHVDLSDIELKDIRLRMNIGPTYFDLRGVDLKGSFRLNGAVMSVGLWSRAEATIRDGVWIQNGQRFSLAKTKIAGARIVGHALEVDDLQSRLAGSRIRIFGHIKDLFHPSRSVLTATATTHRGAALIQSITGVTLPDPVKMQLSASGSIKGPVAKLSFTAPRLPIAARLDLANLGGEAQFDPDTLQVIINKVHAKALQGRIEGAGGLNLKSNKWQATIAIDGINPAPFLQKTISGLINGQLSLKGALDGSRSTAQANAKLVLRKIAGRRSRLPNKVELNGKIAYAMGRIALRNVSLSTYSNKVSARGSINLARGGVADISFSANIPAANHLLRPALGFSPIAELSATGRIQGNLKNPALRAKFQSKRIRYGPISLSSLAGDIGISAGVLSLENLRSKALPGKFWGSGRLRLYKNTIARPLADPTIDAIFRLKNAPIANLLDRQIKDRFGMSGRISANFSVQGTLSRPRGALTARTTDALYFNGRSYDQVRARMGVLPDRLTIYEAQVKHRILGSAEARGDVFYNGRLSLDIVGKKVNLHQFSGLGAGELSGNLSTRIRVLGTYFAPAITGDIAVSDLYVRGASWGSGTLALGYDQPVEKNVQDKRVAFRGSIMGEHLGLSGVLFFGNDPALDLRLRFDRFPLHVLIQPEIEKINFGELRGQTSGTLELRISQKEGLERARMDLSAISLALRYRPLGQLRLQTIELNARKPLRVDYNGGYLRLDPVELVSSFPDNSGPRTTNEQARFRLSGQLAPEGSNLNIQGEIPLALSEVFLQRRVKSISGKVNASLRLIGRSKALGLEGALRLQRVEIRLPKMEHVLKVPTGTLEFKRGLVTLRDFLVHMRGRDLRAHGHLSISETFPFTPKSIKMKLDGEVNLSLLQLVFYEQLSRARGATAVHLALEGPFLDPKITGGLQVIKAEIVPRGLGRVVELSAGEVTFSNYLVCIGGKIACEEGKICRSSQQICRYNTPIQGHYDEGSVRAFGEARFDQSQLADLFLRVSGKSIPHRMPNVLMAEYNADLTLLGDQEALALVGDVNVVDARYIREFDIVRNATLRARTYEESESFWKGTNVLEKMSLDLKVRSTGPLRIKNRYANLGLSAAVAVNGSLSDPRLHGALRVEEGDFRVPFLRGRYEVERGEVVFDKNQERDDAEIDILVTSTHLARGGTEYQIDVGLRGSVKKIDIELTSRPHLERGQILSLLATGRTTEQWRTDSGSSESGAGVAAADAQVKELTAEVLSSIEDPIRRAIGLDLLRLEIGTETLAARACKNIERSIEVCGGVEKDLFGGLTGQASTRYKIHDYLRLVGRIERLSTRIEREQERPSRGRIELKFRLPLR